MQMTVWQGLVTIAAAAAGTMLTRFLPFLLFPDGKPLPSFVRYLGTVLPGAVIAMLLVYCFQSVDVATYPHGLPSLLAALAVVALHRWKRNMLLSIAGGTLCYMVLIQWVFAG